MNQAKKRLEELRVELRTPRISCEERAELKGLVDQIEPGDVELLEAAGITERCVARDLTGISCLEQFPSNPDEWCSTCAYYIKRSRYTVH